MSTIKLDLNIYNYTIDEMLKLLKLGNNYDYTDIVKQGNIIIGEINKLNICNNKTDKIIDFIKQVVYFVENDKHNKDKHEYLKLLVKKQTMISEEFKKITMQLENKNKASI